MLRTKRVYEPRDADDGLRVLVMRLWPRGIRKQAIDLWLKELGAGVASLRAWKAGAIDWPEMAKRYVEGLAAPAAAAELRQLAALAKRRTVTILCSCADESECHRGILKARLAKAPGATSRRAGGRPARPRA
jgi:uncharacterized protein YeaO (DUF488 family)